MRRLALAIALLIPCVASAQNPVFQSLTTSGPATVGGTLGVTGLATLGGGLTIENGQPLGSPNAYAMTSSGILFVPPVTINNSATINSWVLVTTNSSYSGSIPNPTIWSQTSASGTVVGGLNSINLITSPVDTVTAAGATAGVLNLFSVLENSGGAAMTGSRTTINGLFNLIATSGNTTGVGGSYSASQFTAQTAVNDNGTATTQAGARGILYGTNSVVGLSTGATFWAGAVGNETDIYVKTGASVLDKIGFQVVQVTGDAVAGTRDDVGFSINNQGSTPGWQYGLEFGRAGGEFPLSSTGTMIYAQGNLGAAFTIGNGIDWHLGIFSGNSWNDGHIQMTGAGDLLANSATVLPTSATAGFIHLPHTAAAPTGTPTNTTPGCEWNTATHTLNCYDGASWYHFTGTLGSS